MKKILLTTAAAVALCASSAFATESNLYVRVDAGATKIENIKYIFEETIKGNTNFLMSGGLGYYFMDNLRSEIIINHTFNPKFKTFDEIAIDKLDLKVDSSLWNWYADVSDFGMAKLFLGAGAGIARLDGDLKTTEFSNNIFTKESFGSKTNFSYALYAGVSSEIDHGIHLDIAYQFQDFGKLRDSDLRVKSHNITCGIRFDI